MIKSPLGAQQKNTLLDEVYVTRIRLKTLFGVKINYFDLRPSLTSVGKKRYDMAVLTHFILKCDRNAEIASKAQYWRLRLRYFRELNRINARIGTREADKYMLRWGYLLEHDARFDELIHGVNSTDAWEALNSLDN